MKNTNILNLNSKALIYAGFACHAIAAFSAFLLPYGLTVLSCIGTKPSDTCGVLLFGFFPITTTLSVSSFLAALFLSFLSANAFLLILLGIVILGAAAFGVYHQGSIILYGYIAYCALSVIFPVCYYMIDREKNRVKS